MRSKSLLCAALLALGLVLAPFVPADRAKADAPYPFGILGNETGSAAGSGRTTIVVGDSLVWGMSQQLADLMSGSTRRSTFVAASAGASVPNFTNRGWLDHPPWGGPNLSTIGEYNSFLRARVTVIALGTNDVRIMAGRPDLYDAADHRAALNTAIVQARSSSRCVFLVNPADHSGADRSDEVRAVDRNIVAAATGNVFRVDWKGYSAGHEDWFAGPGDPHHSEAGRLRYADLIQRSVLEKIRAGRC